MADKMKLMQPGNKAGRTAAQAVAAIQTVLKGRTALWVSPQGTWEITAKKLPDHPPKDPRPAWVDEPQNPNLDLKMFMAAPAISCPKCQSTRVTLEHRDDGKGQHGEGATCQNDFWWLTMGRKYTKEGVC